MRPRAKRLRAAAWLPLAIALFGSSTMHAQVSRGQSGSVTQRLDVDSLLLAAESGEPFELDLGDVLFVVEVERRDLLADGFRASAVNSDGARRVLPRTSRTFRGRVVGDDESSVRLSFGRRGLFAYLRSGDDEYFVEPATHETASALALHKSTPAWEIPGSGTCACATLDESVYVRRDVARHPTPSEVALEAEGDLIVEIAIEADFEYYEIEGEDTVASITDVMNVVEGIYEADLGITFEITSLTYWEEDIDPYTSTDALTLLNELQGTWNSSHGDIQRDVVHLFTGKELDGSTVGIAFVGEVCDTSGAYGLSQELGSMTLMPTLVAHELGHNFGAFHDPSDDDPRYVMNPTLSSLTLQSFSTNSQDEIADFVDGIGCLEIETADDGDGDPGGDEESGDGDGDGGGTGGGGGGGPVDPYLLAIVAAAALARRKAPAERKRCR
jgi:hypothetical protein